MTNASTLRRLHLLAEFERLDGEIAVELRAAKDRHLSVALKLAQIEDGSMRAVAGYASLAAYAHQVHGLAKSTSNEWLGVGRACRSWPELQAALASDAICWSSARELVKFTSAEDRGDWLGRALRMPFPEFQEEVRMVFPSYTRTLNDLTKDEAVLLDAVVQRERQTLGKPIAYDKALASFCRRMAEGEEPGRLKPTIVIDICAECGKASARTTSGPMPLEPSEAAAAACDARVIDVRDGTGEVKRTLPAKVQRQVEARDKGRCVVPGCKNRLTQIHHMDGWEHGHDPKRLQTLCKLHHDLMHKGYLRCEGDMPGVKFFLADGRFIGVAGEPIRSCGSVQ